jgi:galactokinase
LSQSVTVFKGPMVLRVPGRLCLFGEHSDWAGAARKTNASIAPGACLVTGTDQGIRATAEADSCFEMVSRLPGGADDVTLRLPMEATALRRVARSGGFFSYAAGVAAEIWARYQPPGVRLVVTDMDLPVKRGLSSSAAVCVLVARAFNRVHGLGLGVRDEMELAYRGEIACGSLCGRMDQVCAYGRGPVLLHFDGDALDIEPLHAQGVVSLLIVDLMRPKDTRRILSALSACFNGRDSARRRALRRALGADNADLVCRARHALECTDAHTLGALMTEAQELFDRCVAPACPQELSAPRLHEVLAHPTARALAWGGKGVGSQGDGAAQFVCRGTDERKRLARELTDRFGVQCLPLTIGGTDGS